MYTDEKEPIREDNPFVEKFEAFFKDRLKKEIERIAAEYPTKKSISFDFIELEHYDPDLADELLDNPDKCLEAAQFAIKNLDVSLLEVDDFEPHVRVFNLPSERQPVLRDLSSTHIGKLITVEGVVRQVTEVLPKLKFATWVCTRCGANYKIPQTRNQPKQPNICAECKAKSFVLEEETSEFMDYQKIQIQEPLELLKGSEQATNLDIYVSDDLVNMVAPGDRTKITGIIRLMPPKEKKIVYGRYLEALHLEETEKEFEDVEINKEEEEEIKKLALRDDIYDLLVQSIAPNIYGHEIMKESIALQLFGGVKKTLPNGQGIRGNIHILIVGDPGLAKCVSGCTKILLEDGASLKMDGFVNGFFTEENAIPLDDGKYAAINCVIPSMDLNGKIGKSRAIRAFKRKPSKMFEITTKSGKKIKVTHTHPFFIPYKGKIKAVKTQCLDTNDYVAVPRKLRLAAETQELEKIVRRKTNAIHIKMPEKLEEGLARMLGYFCAEGYSRKAKTTINIRFTNNDAEVLEDFKKIAEETFGIRVSHRKRNNSTELIIDSLELGLFFEKNFPTIMKTSFYKEVPEKVLKSPLEVKKNFLKGFIEGEGHVRKDCRAIEVCTASPELAEQIPQLLLEFGIICSNKEVTRYAANTENQTRRRYRKMIISGKFALKYVQKIGFITQRKKLSAKKAILSQNKYNTNVDIIPAIGNELKKTRQKLGLTQFEMGVPRATYQHFERGDRNPSRETLQVIALNLIQKLEQKNIYDKETQECILNIHKQAFSEVFWDKIEKIKEIQCEEWVYDIEADDEAHNFISNGIISHNSQILRATDAIAPKSIYVAGKTTSGAGISATAVKDEFGEGGWTLKAGALVLASGGMAMVDEFDKMDPNDRSAMHEALEQQQISVAKAGIVTKFKTETSVLAAANPKYSRFDPYQPFIEQINLPPTLISRFDLFFMMRDILDRTKDLEIATHILKSHKAGEMISQRKKRGIRKKDKELDELTELITPKISGEMLKKYISYARQNIFPILTTDGMKQISDFYIDLRDQGRKEGAYAATHRQLEGIIRLSEASARVRLSNSVDPQDVDRSIRLVRTSLEDLVTDPETGKIDIDIITSGQTHTQLANLKKVLNIIKEKARELDLVPLEEVIAEAKATGMDAEKVKEIIAKLEKSGDVYKPKHGFVKPA